MTLARQLFASLAIYPFNLSIAPYLPSLTVLPAARQEKLANMATKTYDYIIVGGGTAGCVVASRLSERQSSLSILVIEAGADITNHPHVYNPLEASHLHFSDIDFKYFTVPQKNLDNKPRYVCGVKALSGAIAINAGMAALMLSD